MSVLLDTSVLGRLANRSDAAHSIATTAVAALHRKGEVLFITPQNLIEFRNFATRPIAGNGPGLSAPAADGLSAVFEATFPLMEETSAIFSEWKSLVTSLGTIGKQVHDARLFAVCLANSVTHLMTFNVAHFLRFTNVSPSVALIDPATVTGP